MHIWVGIDVAKQVHWATAVDEAGEVRIDRAVPNSPAAIEALIADLKALNGEVVIGLDVIGGIAGLVTAMLAAAGFRLVHVPGLAVNRARQATTGGETKSDSKDARVIADQLRLRRDFRAIEAPSELDLEIRLLSGRRRDLVDEQTRRVARLHDLLVAVFPGLEQILDLTTKAGLLLIARYPTPNELRQAGRRRLLQYFKRVGGIPRIETFVDAALAAAHEQRINLPGELATGALIRELTAEALTIRERLESLDRQLEALLVRHPDATLIRSLPGMGAVLTAEFIAEVGDISRFASADALAAAAGLAPVLRQSGKVRFQRRPLRGNRTLKRVFYMSAFCSLNAPASRTFYDRKRREGKRHRQALIALARRRISVLWAMLHSRKPYISQAEPIAA